MEEQPVLLLAMVKEILYTGMVVAAIARAAIAKTAIAKQEVLESSQIYISVKRNGDFLFIF
jgi:hypothetical protein